MSETRPVRPDSFRDFDYEQQGPTYDTPSAGLPNDRGEAVPPPSPLEWFVRIASLVALGTIIAYLVFLCFRPTIPAQFDITPDFGSAIEIDGQWALPFEVVNTSTESVTSLTVAILQEDGGETIERTTTFYLLGEGETVSAEVHLPRRPTEDNTSSEIHIYQSP